MPEAKSKYSTDYYLYNYITNPIAKRICFISPNIITFLGTLLVIPIIQNLVNNGSVYVYMFLIILRYLFDCFDGSVARECNKKSKFGAIFDILSDSIGNLIIGSFIIYLIIKRKKNILLNTLIIIIIISIIFTNIYDLKNELLNDRSGTISGKSNYFDNTIIETIHDNLLILVVCSFLTIKLYIN